MVLPKNLPEKPGKIVGLNFILKDISGKRADVITIQRELVARPALNPEDGGDGEETKARWIENWLLTKGLPQAERIDAPDERVSSRVRPNLIIHYPGLSDRTLWIVAHFDTSPPGSPDLWTGSPWALRVVGDTIYGRGVEDNHQAIVSGLILMESLSRNGAVPPLSLGLVFTSGEKTGYPRRFGLEAILQAKPDLFKPGDLVVVNDYGNAEGSLVELAEKGLLWLKFTVTGKQSSAAQPHKGISALDAAVNLITELRGLHEKFPAKNALFVPDTSTFVPTKVEKGSDYFNQMPGKFVFGMDCRLLSPYTAEEVFLAVREMADRIEKQDRVQIDVERVASIPAFPGTSEDAPVVQALVRAIKAHLGVEISFEGIGGITLAADLRARNLPVVVWAKSESMGHSSNEHISINDLLDASKIFGRILFDSEALTAIPETPVEKVSAAGAP